MSVRSEVIRIFNELIGQAKKISDLPAAGSVDGADLVEISQGGVSKKATAAQIGSGGSGVVQTIVAGTNVTVDDTDPANPIVSSSGGSGVVESIVAGSNITVDDTDPANPIISASGGGGGGTWGSITGTLSSQTDLQAALDAKQDDITFGAGVQTFLGTPSSANLATALTDEVGTGAVLFSEMPVNIQTGTTYTSVLGDRGGQIVFTNASPITFTVPTNASVAYPTGTEIWLKGIASGVVTVVAPSGGSVSSTAGSLVSPSASGTDFSMVLKKTGTNTWTLDNGTAPINGTALTKVDDTNVTLTLGGNPSTALVNSASITVGWTGNLATTRGGTGLASVATGGLIQGSGTNTFSELASVSAGSYLRSGGVSTVSVWSTLKLPNSATANRIPYATSTNTIGESANLTFDGNTLAVAGSLTLSIATFTTDVTLGNTHHTVLMNVSVNRIVTLPAAAGNTGRVYVIKKIDASAFTVTIDGNASETIDGATTKVLALQYAGMTIQCDGSNWHIIGIF
jgi:hypothetical protein